MHRQAMQGLGAPAPTALPSNARGGKTNSQAEQNLCNMVLLGLESKAGDHLRPPPALAHLPSKERETSLNTIVEAVMPHRDCLTPTAIEATKVATA
jgi:hypothetical protein